MQLTRKDTPVQNQDPTREGDAKGTFTEISHQ